MENDVFSNRLKLYITKSGFSLFELSRRAGLSYSEVKDWLEGKKLPSRNQILSLAATIKSSIDDTNTMLMTVGYLPLTNDEIDDQISSIDSMKPVNIGAKINNIKPVNISAKDVIESYATQRQINLLLEETSKRLLALEDLIKSNNETKNSKRQEDVNSELSKLKDSVAEIEIANRQLNIPLDLPTSDDLKVTLVPSTALGQLEEYRSEENKWFSVSGIFLGSVLGLLSNWANGSEMSSSAWTMLILFSIMSVFTGWNGYSYKVKGDNVKKKKLHMDD